MKHKHQEMSEEGFTLIELLVSIIVGAILVGSVNTVYTNQLALSQQTRDTVLANAFAESKIEALRSKGYLGVNNGTSNITSEMPSELQSPRSATLAVSTQSTSVKKVLLTITYLSSGRSQTFTYTTYLGELGVGQY
jgi:prepilin-type N-terminal cleavage/methylation domain-containing protein